jgi:hypothetical protein
MDHIELTKQQILDTNNWHLCDYINLMEGFLWKHLNKTDHNITFYMRRTINDGYTKIEESDSLDDDKVIFEGYIKNLKDLEDITRLLELRETTEYFLK